MSRPNLRLPEMINTILPVYLALGIPEDQAESLAAIAVIAISRRYGGDEVFIPTTYGLSQSYRNRAIKGEYNGDNLANLAEKHNLSFSQVYRILKAV